MGNTMRKLVITTDVIDTIIRGTENNTNNLQKDNNMTKKKLNLQKDWEAVLEKYGLKEDKRGTLRDAKGRFVKFELNADELDKLTKPDEEKLEMDFNDNPTGVTEAVANDRDEDILGDLPDWSSMNLEAILARCIYMKKEVRKDGRIIRVPILKETVCEDGKVHSMPIPVRKAGDGEEIGFNRWAKQEPEEMYLQRATKAANYLVDWDQEELLNRLDKEIERLKTGLVTAAHLHPYQDGEDVIQAILLQVAEKKTKVINEGKRALIKLAKKGAAQGIWRFIKNEVEILSQEVTWPGDDFKVVSDKINYIAKKAMEKVYTVCETKEFIEGFGFVNTGGGITKEAWVAINRSISTYAWGTITGSLEPEVKGALWGTAARYVSNMLALEMLKVLEDNNSVDRQTECIVGEKTPMDEWFKKEEADWVWMNRTNDWDDMPRGWLGRLPWQDKVKAEYGSNNE